MAEKKNVHSSPAKTPKLQLTAEQPLTGECWIPPKKDTPYPRAKEKPQQGSSVQFSSVLSLSGVRLFATP